MVAPAVMVVAVVAVAAAMVVELAADGEYVGSKRTVLEPDPDADGDVVTGTAVFPAPIRPGKDPRE